MPRETKGQVPLPGDPELLLQATAQGPGETSYVALSVARSQDGTVRVRETHLDPSSRRVVTRLLDEFDTNRVELLGIVGYSDAEILQHWAGELRVSAQDPLW
jgi:hypothetical protein